MIKSLRSHLISKWYLYVAWAVAAVLLWSWIFSLLTKPKAEEKVVVFVGAYSCEQILLEEELSKDMPQYLREVDVVYFDLNDFNFQMFLTIKSPETDIFILPASVLESIGESRFLPFEENAAREAFGECDLFEINGAYYGVKLQKSLKYLGFGEDGKEQFYLLFNRNSPHTGGLSSARYNGAVEIAGRILSL